MIEFSKWDVRRKEEEFTHALEQVPSPCVARKTKSQAQTMPPIVISLVPLGVHIPEGNFVQTVQP